jgi:hypothetical protein
VRAGGRHGHQRVEGERVGVARERLEPGRAGAVPDGGARRNQRRGGRDLAVRDAQQHGVHAGRRGAASERAFDLEPRGGDESGGYRRAQPARADHGNSGRLTGRLVLGEIPFQFPHLRYRSA